MARTPTVGLLVRIRKTEARRELHGQLATVARVTPDPAMGETVLRLLFAPTWLGWILAATTVAGLADVASRDVELT